MLYTMHLYFSQTALKSKTDMSATHAYKNSAGTTLFLRNPPRQLKTILPMLFPLVKAGGQTDRRGGGANPPMIKTQTGSHPDPLLSSATQPSHCKGWPQQKLEVIGYPPWISKHNTEIKVPQKHKHACYTTHPLVCAVILSMLVWELGLRKGL